MADEGEEMEMEEEVDPHDLAEQLAPALWDACRRDDTDKVLELVEQGADPLMEDKKAWTPLIWAACHGNLALTRRLLDGEPSAAESYRVDGEAGAVEREPQKHSPLHWAAFKGHLHVLWLLLHENLSPNDQDQIGNTVLHQAAAGGHLNVVECLLAQGVDVHKTNNRGHTPFVLCTDQAVRQVLQQAMDSKACKDTGKQFSTSVARYMCSWSMGFFCEERVFRTFVYDTPESEAKEKPVTWCQDVRETILDLEQQLQAAMRQGDLAVITEKLALVGDQPVDVKLVHQCRQVQKKLESEIALRSAMEVPDLTVLEDFSKAIEVLSKAIEDAITHQAEQSLLARAKMLRRRLAAEYNLSKAMVLQSAVTSDAHLRMLEEVAEQARLKQAREDLLDLASKLIRKLHSEKAVQKHILEAGPVAQCASGKDLEALTLPWVTDLEKFALFHVQYKGVVAKAEANGIAAELLESAATQLGKIETLLIEQKQLEAENQLKASKKKKGKK